MAKRMAKRRKRASKSTNGKHGGNGNGDVVDALARRRAPASQTGKRCEIAILKETIRVLEERIHTLQGEGCYSTGT